MTKKHVFEDLRLIPGSKPTKVTVRLSPEFAIHLHTNPEGGPKLYYDMLAGLLQWCAGMNRCPNCGLILMSDVTYCPRCGQKLPTDEAESAGSADSAAPAPKKERCP